MLFIITFFLINRTSTCIQMKIIPYSLTSFTHKDDQLNLSGFGRGFQIISFYPSAFSLISCLEYDCNSWRSSSHIMILRVEITS